MAGDTVQAETLPINFQDVLRAKENISGLVHNTPVMTCSYLDSVAGFQLFFKCENLQRTGSFKIRGALNAAKNCEKTDPVFVTHSSGNHAQAVAMAAKLCKRKAHVVVPNTTPQVKQDAVRGLGAEITGCINTEPERDRVAKEVMAKIGPQAHFVSSCNHPDIMAGQGTLALEFLNEVPDLDCIVASISGGGLISGICVAAKGINPKIKVIGVEPTTADDCAKSLAAGRHIPLPGPPKTVCEALMVSVSSRPWEVIRQLINGVVTVPDEDTISMMKTVWLRMKLVVETSAACSVAAVMTEEFRKLAGPDVKKVGVVLCGGNVDLDSLPWINPKTYE